MVDVPRPLKYYVFIVRPRDEDSSRTRLFFTSRTLIPLFHFIKRDNTLPHNIFVTQEFTKLKRFNCPKSKKVVDNLPC